MATLDPGAAPRLTQKWIDRVAAEYGQELQVTVEAIQAVRLLIRLCQTALQEGLDVVHTWYL